MPVHTPTYWHRQTLGQLQLNLECVCKLLPHVSKPSQVAAYSHKTELL